MDSHQAMGKIFNNLTIWRNLPKYQLERRADIFFSLYLQEVLEAKLSEHGEPVEMLPQIIPEFPLKQEMDKNYTVNVDYVMFSKDTVYLIEFKTDMGSFRDKQYEYLIDAMIKIKKDGFKTILDEIKVVFNATDDKQKYYYLFKVFEELTFVELPSELNEKIFPVLPGAARGVNKAIESIETKCSIKKVVTIFLQPEYSIDQESKFRDLLKKRDVEEYINDVKFITFTDVIKQISKSEDPFNRLFRDYIEMWIEKAGATPREKVLRRVGKLSFLHRTKIPTKPPGRQIQEV